MPSLMRRINVISRCASLYRADRLSGDLGGCHHSFVFCISKNPGMSQDEIARHLCINKSTVARTVSYLEDRGYVYRESDSHDKRISRVYPTEKMLETLPRVREITQEWNSFVSEGIDEGELEIFTRVLEQIESRARELATGGDRR